MFGGKIYGIEAGSKSCLINMTAVSRHGFDQTWEAMESIEVGLLAQLDGCLVGVTTFAA